MEYVTALRPGFLYALFVASLLFGLSEMPPPKYIDVGIYSVIDDLSVIPVVVALDTATSEDTVIIHMNSPGGDVVAGMKVMAAMETSKAKNIIVSVDLLAASMAAEIAQEAPVMEVKPHSIILIHTISIPLPDGSSLKILPYERNETIAAVDPITATLAMAESRFLFVKTSLNSWGLWTAQDLFDVAAGQDVTELAGGHIWGRVDPGFVGGNFDLLAMQYSLDVPSNSRPDDFLTGLIWNKVLSLTYHVTLLNLEN